MLRKLEEILTNCKVLKISGNRDQLNGKIVFDSRRVEKGDLFVAIKGTIADGHDFVSSAIEKGADFIVCERLPDFVLEEVTYIVVDDSARTLGIMAANFYGNPSENLKVVGVTGTNGKTTVASLLYEMTLSLGYSAGLFSTLKVRFNDKELPASHTTPDPVRLHSVFREMLNRGVEYVFMEVSSHAIHQERISGIRFRGGVFTNLSHDHLDYHGTFKNYLETKKKFFDDLPATAFALVNLDDKNGKVMIQNTRADIHTYSFRTLANFRAKLIESHFEGNLLSVNGNEMWTRLPGLFNAYNCLAVYGTGVLLGFKQEEVLLSISEQKSVEGRFEIIRSERGTTGIVDYAHTPDALANVLQTINGIRNGKKRLITIIGAGGDRDRAKRPLMARIAAEKSDKVILTSDNPRNEDPEKIIEDMKEGLDPILMRKIISITSREEAIKTACSFAGTEDIILLAGKGHETYQEIKGKRHHFDDREKLKLYINT
ncbi:MAG: UDP-N-acetylmuramoyl-L-alanyl-D-glutamate--2,6-diaminopimelate ligase [Bacteroidota bacterium]